MNFMTRRGKSRNRNNFFRVIKKKKKSENSLASHNALCSADCATEKTTSAQSWITNEEREGGVSLHVKTHVEKDRRENENVIGNTSRHIQSRAQPF